MEVSNDISIEQREQWGFSKDEPVYVLGKIVKKQSNTGTHYRLFNVRSTVPPYDSLHYMNSSDLQLKGVWISNVDKKRLDEIYDSEGDNVVICELELAPIREQERHFNKNLVNVKVGSINPTKIIIPNISTIKEIKAASVDGRKLILTEALYEHESVLAQKAIDELQNEQEGLQNLVSELSNAVEEKKSEENNYLNKIEEYRYEMESLIKEKAEMDAITKKLTEAINKKMSLLDQLN